MSGWTQRHHGSEEVEPLRGADDSALPPPPPPAGRWRPPPTPPVRRVLPSLFNRPQVSVSAMPSLASLRALADHMLVEADAQEQITRKPGIPAGFTYLSQFIAHDITFHP